MNTYFKVSLFYFGLFITYIMAQNITDIEDNDNNVFTVVHTVKIPFIIKVWFTLETLRLLIG